MLVTTCRAIGLAACKCFD